MFMNNNINNGYTWVLLYNISTLFMNNNVKSGCTWFWYITFLHFYTMSYIAISWTKSLYLLITK
jgi:hypothetical protein